MPAPNGMTPRYYGSASNNPNSLRSESNMFTRNFVPAGPARGLRLLFNNTRFSLRNSNNGAVGTTALASRAYNRGRASARNAAAKRA